MNIDKHVSLGHLYAASLSLERLPASSEMTAASVLIQDAMRDVEKLIDSQALAVSAAVMAEREAIRSHLDSELKMTAPWDFFSWEAGVLAAIEYIDSRTSPAVDVLAVVREWRDAKKQFHERPTGHRGDDLRAIMTRIDETEAALMALVDGAPKAAPKDGSISDIERTLDRMYARREGAEAEDGGAEG